MTLGLIFSVKSYFILNFSSCSTPDKFIEVLDLGFESHDENDDQIKES